VIEYYDKCGNCENYTKEAKCDLVVKHLLLQPFWANKAIFQLMMLLYNPFFAVQDGLRNGNRIPAANQDIPIEVHFLVREDHQNSKERGDEALGKISILGDLWKKLVWMKCRLHMFQPVITF